MMSEYDYRNIEIKFGGDIDEIDVDTLIQALSNYSSVIQETSAYLSPGSKVEIKIKATNKGSYIVLLKLIAQHATSLFSVDNLTNAASIITIVGGLFKVKQWMAKKGKPDYVIDKGNDYFELMNNKGSITINHNVYNIYVENQRIRENLKNTFSALEKHEEIKTFSITDTDTAEKIFEAENEDFHPMALSDDEIEQRKQRVIKESQELSIFKIVFKEDCKWEFFYQGNKIYASWHDNREYFGKIEKGEVAFRSGDKLIVDLEIVQVFNESANTFVNESYFIKRVIQHIPRNPPIQLSTGIEEL